MRGLFPAKVAADAKAAKEAKEAKARRISKDAMETKLRRPSKEAKPEAPAPLRRSSSTSLLIDSGAAGGQAVRQAPLSPLSISSGSGETAGAEGGGDGGGGGGGGGESKSEGGREGGGEGGVGGGAGEARPAEALVRRFVTSG